MEGKKKPAAWCGALLGGKESYPGRDGRRMHESRWTHSFFKEESTVRTSQKISFPQDKSGTKYLLVGTNELEQTGWKKSVFE